MKRNFWAESDHQSPRFWRSLCRVGSWDTSAWLFKRLPISWRLVRPIPTKTSSRCHRPDAPARRKRSRLAYPDPNFCVQRRTVSCETSAPSSASRSSTSRKLSAIKPDGMPHNLSRKAMAGRTQRATDALVSSEEFSHGGERFGCGLKYGELAGDEGMAKLLNRDSGRANTDEWQALFFLSSTLHHPTRG